MGTWNQPADRIDMMGYGGGFLHGGPYISHHSSTWLVENGKGMVIHGAPWRTGKSGETPKTWIKTLFKQLDIPKSKIWPKTQDINYILQDQSISFCTMLFFGSLTHPHMKPRGSSQNEAHAGAQYTTLEIGIPGGLFSVKTPRRSMGFNGMYTIYGEEWLKDIKKTHRMVPSMWNSSTKPEFLEVVLIVVRETFWDILRWHQIISAEFGDAWYVDMPWHAAKT